MNQFQILTIPHSHSTPSSPKVNALSLPSRLLHHSRFKFYLALAISSLSSSSSSSMGNGGTKLTGCFSSCGTVGHCRRRGSSAVTSEPYEEELGHSFCYVRPDPLFPRSTSSNKVHHSDENTIFRSVSGAALSANAATPLSTALDTSSSPAAVPAAFESSTCFSSTLLHPLSDRCSIPIDRRGFTSSPIDSLDRRTAAAGVMPRSLSHGLGLRRHTAASLLRSFTNSISRTISVPVTETHSFDIAGGGENLHWAQGRAGEDRIHVVISEEQGWIFVGIYDGFNGPDATDYLLSNLYAAVQQELKGLLWDEEKQEVPVAAAPKSTAGNDSDQALTRNRPSTEENNGERKLGMTHTKMKPWRPTRNWNGKQRRWKYEWEREILDSNQTLRKKSNRLRFIGAEHCKVLKSLSHALKKTEEAFLDSADMLVSENPELALMGSCVLVMVMKGEDVYLMNVGDSRAVLAQKSEQNYWDSVGKERQDLEMINEEIENELKSNGGGDGDLVALQLTKDHSTCVEEEVWRIRAEHPEDASAVMNDRVKGSLKVTRAFGAGFLKQPKWNNALLEMFRIDYIGTSPYITCCPFLYHHRLGPGDTFLILSSDGLYQYFTNEEAVAEIDLFVAANPEGDPAQHLVEEVLFRAAKNAGMDFHELLEIPQGDRRRYHDDVSIIVISLEGRIWRSSI